MLKRIFVFTGLTSFCAEFEDVDDEDGDGDGYIKLLLDALVVIDDELDDDEASVI